MRAEKINGNGKLVIRPMHAAMGITMVTEERQTNWNPCAVNNGNCTHLCFFRKKTYTCGCPDEPTPGCETSKYKSKNIGKVVDRYLLLVLLWSDVSFFQNMYIFSTIKYLI